MAGAVGGLKLTPAQPLKLGLAASDTFLLRQLALSQPARAEQQAVVSLRTAASKAAVIVCTLNDACPQWSVEWIGWLVGGCVGGCC